MLRRWAIRGWWGLALWLLCVPAWAQDSGIGRIAVLQDRAPQAASTLPLLPESAFADTVATDRLADAHDGYGWWRVQPTSGAGARFGGRWS